MDRLQAVAHVGQGARHDHAHRVIEVGGFISSTMEIGEMSLESINVGGSVAKALSCLRDRPRRKGAGSPVA